MAVKFILVEESETYHRLALTGELDREGVTEISWEFLVYAHGKALIVDVSEVTMLTSAGMGMLMRAHSYLKEEGLRMVLLKPQPLIEEILSHAGFQEVVPVVHDERKALEILVET